MSKSNPFIKIFKNINNSINSLLEKNLNKLNLKNIKNLTTNNKIILTFVALFVLFISYLLLPTLYKQQDLSNKLTSELSKKLNIQFKFSNKITYNFFPLPHFKVSDAIILHNKSEKSKIKHLKIYLYFENFFSVKNVKIKNIQIEEANFNFKKTNYNFFLKLLNNNFTNETLKIKNSNIFFRNSKNEVLLINKILDMKYFYDTKELKNIVKSKNQIFNIPYDIRFYDNKIEKKLMSRISIDFLKLQINNEFVYGEKVKIGKADLVFKKTKSIFKYKKDKKRFEFDFFDKIENQNFFYSGIININPFYSTINGKADEIDASYLFNKNGIIAQLIKTEIFNNKNIDFSLKINSKKTNNNFIFENIIFNSKIQEGLIDIDGTQFKWKNYASFKLDDSLIYLKKGELFLDGKVRININKNEEIYKYLLTPKKYRKKLSIIEFGFSYNYDQKITILTDIKINNVYNQSLNKIMSNITLKDNNLQNKIYLKNLINEAIKSYSG